MKILALDTTSQVASAALLENDILVAETTINHPKTHSQKLMPIIENILESVDWEIKDLFGIAVSSGPGSFTGVRIGLSVAKGLAHPFNLPIATISSLEGLAYNFIGFDGLICPVLDARREEVYTAVYRWQAGELVTVLKETPMALEFLLKRLAGGHARRIVFLGDGAGKFSEKIHSVLGARASIAPPTLCMPRAASVALAASKKDKEQWVKYDYVKANYLRRSEAEVTWEKKHASACEGKDKQ